MFRWTPESSGIGRTLIFLFVATAVFKTALPRFFFAAALLDLKNYMLGIYFLRKTTEKAIESHRRAGK
jgi:hypothetical protein